MAELDGSIPLKAYDFGELQKIQNENSLGSSRAVAAQNEVSQIPLSNKSKQLEYAKQQNEAVAQLLSSSVDQNTWSANKQRAAQMGIDVTNVPDQYDPAIKQQLLTSSLTTAQRLDYELKKSSAALAAEDTAYQRQKDTRDFGLKEREVRAKEAENAITPMGGLGSSMASPVDNPNAPIQNAPMNDVSALINGLNPLQKSQLMMESAGNPNAVSPKGAQGLMQLMPGTAQDPGFGVSPARDSSPQENVRVGTEYQQALTQKYGDPAIALVAYNWGPGNTDKWLASGGDPSKLPAETRNYVQKVLSGASGPQALPAEQKMAPVKQGNTFIQPLYKKGLPLTEGLKDGQQWGIDTRTGERRAMDIPGYTSDDQRKLKDALPAAIESSTQTLQLLDKLVGSRDGRIKPHPGLSTSVGAKGPMGGLLGGWVPPGGKGADFNALLERVKGKQFLEAFQTLKGAGAITEVEGAKAENAIASLQTAQSEKAFIQSANEFRDVIEKAIKTNKAKISGSGQTATEAPASTVGWEDYFK